MAAPATTRWLAAPTTPTPLDFTGDVASQEQANEGTDTVRTSLAAYTLGANVENLTYTGTAAFTGTRQYRQQRHHWRRWRGQARRQGRR
ncbi:hypothetical protein AB5I41_07750 [Sphingomonas sp. MMS24-JH45]